MAMKFIVPASRLAFSSFLLRIDGTCCSSMDTLA
jgi:hypothetical protein